jgi:hypothetical protein
VFPHAAGNRVLNVICPARRFGRSERLERRFGRIRGSRRAKARRRGDDLLQGRGGARIADIERTAEETVGTTTTALTLWRGF